MPCIVVLKEKIVPSAKHFLWGGGGAQLGSFKKKLMSLGAQEENVLTEENSPGPPVTL